MVKQFFKKRSKRMTCRKKYKIEKKVREHNRKLNKESKKPISKAKRRRKDGGVPNNAPFKEAVLREAEEYRQKAFEEKEKKKIKKKNKRKYDELRKQKRAKETEAATTSTPANDLADLVEDAARRDADFEMQEDGADVTDHRTSDVTEHKDASLAYFKEVRKVVEEADVLLQVLDARDPLGSRCKELETMIQSAGPDKRLVLLLNKIDLVPKGNVEEWLKYLRREYPALGFKASTQCQTSNLAQSAQKLSKLKQSEVGGGRCLGAATLMKLLGNYCRNKDLKRAIRVGVVGYPNTGKSSVINSLKRAKVCGSGAAPGVTRTVQEVQLDSHVRLLDSPGVVLGRRDDVTAVLHSTLRPEQLDDPLPAAERVLSLCQHDQLIVLYGIARFESTAEFLALLAARMGRLKKGGRPDVNKAARTLLRDWTSGKIRYYSRPPTVSEAEQSVSIVTELADEFDINSVNLEEQKDLAALPKADQAPAIFDGTLPVIQNENIVVQDVPMERRKTKGGRKQTRKDAHDRALGLKQNTDSRVRKHEMKALKRKKKRNEKIVGNLSDKLEQAFAGLGSKMSTENS